MRFLRRFIPGFCWLLAFLLLPACVMIESSPTPSSTPSAPLLTIAGILQDYTTYEDQLVRVQGHGIIEAMMPLCPGYAGMDTRMVFVDEAGENMPAVLVGDIWEQAVMNDTLREFRAYIRVFSGEIGCPDSLQTRTFPYLEIIEVGE